MMAISYERATAINGSQGPSRYAPYSMPSQAMCACGAAASAATIMMKTDVITSVSLFVLFHLVIPVSLIIGIVVLISLLLIGLTGRIRQESLVGQANIVATRNARGD